MQLSLNQIFEQSYHYFLINNKNKCKELILNYLTFFKLKII